MKYNLSSVSKHSKLMEVLLDCHGLYALIILHRNHYTMAKAYQMDVTLKEALGKEVFSESYRINLRDEFVNNAIPKEHGFRNHVHSFANQLKLNNGGLPDLTLSKRQIYSCKFGMNVGTEINGIRPSIVYKNNTAHGEDVFVIPLTSTGQKKQQDEFDILVDRTEENNLYQASYARLRQMRPISLRRIGEQIGVLTDEKIMKAIDNGVKAMFGLEVPSTSQ